MRKKNFFLNKEFISILLFMASCLGILLYFHTSTTFDEKYTLLLINHNPLKLITLDALDVHPPLYYFILKYFLVITTFWTQSLFTKIIFARILSLFFAIIAFIYLYKILAYFHFKLSWLWQWCIFVSIPNVLSCFNPYSTSPIVDIRMYSLAGMLIIMELYYLIFLQQNHKINLGIITILLILAMYTHYFAAMIACIMMFVFICKYLFHSCYKTAVKLILSLLISFILYLPWLPYLKKQLSIPISQTANLSKISAIIQIILFIFICLLIIYPYIWSKLHLNTLFNNVLMELISTLTLTIGFIFIFSVTIRPMFSYRYMYPIAWIYEAIAIYILFEYLIYKHNFVTTLFSSLVILLLALNFFGSAYYEYSKVDLPSIEIHKQIISCVYSKHKIFYLNSNNSKTCSPNLSLYNKNKENNIDNTPINFEYAYYLTNYDKYIKTKYLSNYFGIKDRPSYQVLFKNIRYHIINE